MLDWLYRLLGTMMSFFSDITGSYALALLFYALIFKIVFLPFSIKQQKNQIKMAKLAPKIELIKAKYKGRTDQPTLQKQQQEIMELQQKEGYSPLSGCLPLLIQLPLIMLLYTIIQNPLSYIAKTTDTLNNYNDNPKDAIVEELPEELRERYASLIEDGKEISKDDVILELYREFFPATVKKPSAADYSGDDEAYEKAMEDYNEKVEAIVNAESVPKSREITLIGLIEDFIDDEENEEYTTREARENYVSSFGLDHASYPEFKIFGANMAATPSFKNPSLILAIPFITALVQWLSMFLTRKLTGNGGMHTGNDAQTKSSMMMMDLMMPAMTLWMAFSFSAMLGLYWTFQSILGLLQSFILSRVMPMPKFTEEEIREINRQQKEAEKAAKSAIKNQPKHKSLHYIDEDDYDELPDVANKKDDKGDTKLSGGVPEIKD